MSSRKTKVQSSNISGSKTSRKTKKTEDPITLFGSESKPTKKTNKKKEESVDVEDKINDIIQSLQENYIQQKKLMFELKELKTLHKKEIKKARDQSDKKSGKNSGFNKPQPVPEKIRKLLDIDDTHLPRSTVTSLMYQYFRDHNMCGKEKEIIPNKEIRKIFDMDEDDIMNFYNFQTWLKKLYQETQTEERLIL
uniref:Uncharacterized protein n=1 Tax=viral metagenome TaxID=1070528 RepID=A0A6C0CAR2_9ZZZZ